MKAFLQALQLLLMPNPRCHICGRGFEAGQEVHVSGVEVDAVLIPEEFLCSPCLDWAQAEIAVAEMAGVR